MREYLWKGYVVNHRIDKLENEVSNLKGKVSELDFQIKTSLPPNEGVFYEGQIFDALGCEIFGNLNSAAIKCNFLFDVA